MSDVANAPMDLANNSELIADLARFSEGVLTEQQIRRKWRHLDNNVWEAPDDALVDAVEAERVRRIRSGRGAREKAQNLAIQAPDILGTIMTNDGNSPRHRIEAAKELRVVADNGPEVAPAAAAAERFQIIIDLSAGGSDKEILTYDIPTKRDPENVGHDVIDGATERVPLQKPFPITAKRNGDDA